MHARPAISRDRWLVSYADFMTLLCAFFTTLYAASLVRPAAPAPSVVSRPAPLAVAAAPENASRAVRAALELALAAEFDQGRLQLVDDPRGLVIEIPELAVFDAGRADLSPEARQMMTRLSAVLAGVPNGLRVEGHTDDTPIASPRFQSNWELSTARATAVVDVFVREGGLAPERLSAAGYSQFKPRATNASAEGRARNRRVDIVVLNPATETREEPPAGSRQP
jgi:chemotaxis protein MotB